LAWSFISSSAETAFSPSVLRRPRSASGVPALLGSGHRRFRFDTCGFGDVVKEVGVAEWCAPKLKCFGASPVQFDLGHGGPSVLVHLQIKDRRLRVTTSKKN
jgi:hypothetical protein